MIIFGYPIPRKYNKTIIIVLLIIVSILLIGCSKLEFDPKTSIIKYIIKNKDK
jgi:PBP1b-binding outer membrane lipoprotein LpoB